MKNKYYSILSHIFYYIGDLISKLMYININRFYPFQFMFNIYNYFMILSSTYQDKTTNNSGPWKQISS